MFKSTLWKAHWNELHAGVHNLTRIAHSTPGRSVAIVVLTVFCGGVILAPQAQTAHAQTPGDWTEPAMISTTTAKSWFPDVVVDSRGRGHIVWHSERRQGADSADLLMYSVGDGTTYSQPNDIVFPGIGGYTVRPAIAIDAQDRLHISYRQRTDISYVQALSEQAWDASGWTDPHPLSEGQSAYYSDIAVDQKGRIHVVWNEQPTEVQEPKSLWLGTDQGLVRIRSGRALTLTESGPLGGTYTVHAIVEDSVGVEWVGASEGLGRYDGVAWRWLSAEDGFVYGQVLAIAEDPDGSLWLGSARGLVHFNPDLPEAQRWEAIPVPQDLASESIQTIAMDRAGDIWVGTRTGLGSYSGEEWQTFHNEDGLPSEDVTALAASPAGSVWVGTDLGLAEIADGSLDSVSAEDGVTALAVTQDGVLWVASTSGLSRLVGSNWQNISIPASLQGSGVNALKVDHDGVVWAVTDNGILGFVNGIMVFGQPAGGITPAVIRSIEQDLVPNAMCPACMDIFYRRSADRGTTWSVPVNLSRSYAGSVKPQITLDETDGVHVTWEEGEDWYQGAGYPVAAMYRYSPDAGLSWSEPYLFWHPRGAPQQITFSIDREGELLVVWRLPDTPLERTRIYYQRSADQGVTWSDPQPIPGIFAKEWRHLSLDSCDATRDADGNVHLLVLGYLSELQEELSLVYLVWDGTAWSRPLALYTSSSPPEWPAIDAGPGGHTLHATWFTRDEAHIWDSAGGRYRVWAASRQLDTSLPADSGAIIRPKPTPTAMSSAAVSPTPSPVPTISTTSNPPSGIYTDADDTVRLLLSLAPVALVIGLLLVIRRRRAL
jgi:hypothetical protein